MTTRQYHACHLPLADQDWNEYCRTAREGLAQEDKFCPALTQFQIIEAMHEEAIEIIPRHIRRLKKEVAPFKAQIRALEARFLPQDLIDLAQIVLRAANGDMVARLAELNRLQAIFSLCEARAAQKPDANGNLPAPKGLTEEQIARAKASSILAMFAFTKLRHYGVKHMACCPFHTESSPSFYIYDNNTYHCFGCQANGSAIDFYMNINKTDFKTAVLNLTGGL